MSRDIWWISDLKRFRNTGHSVSTWMRVKWNVPRTVNSIICWRQPASVLREQSPDLLKCIVLPNRLSPSSYTFVCSRKHTHELARKSECWCALCCANNTHARSNAASRGHSFLTFSEPVRGGGVVERRKTQAASICVYDWYSCVFVCVFFFIILFWRDSKVRSTTNHIIVTACRCVYAVRACACVRARD